MTTYEYRIAKSKLENIIKRQYKHTLDTKNRADFIKYIELIITVNGHAWCMDVSTERKKISKLLTNATYNYQGSCPAKLLA